MRWQNLFRWSPSIRKDKKSVLNQSKSQPASSPSEGDSGTNNYSQSVLPGQFVFGEDENKWRAYEQYVSRRDAGNQGEMTPRLLRIPRSITDPNGVVNWQNQGNPSVSPLVAYCPHCQHVVTPILSPMDDANRDQAHSNESLLAIGDRYNRGPPLIAMPSEDSGVFEVDENQQFRRRDFSSVEETDAVQEPATPAQEPLPICPQPVSSMRTPVCETAPSAYDWVEEDHQRPLKYCYEETVEQEFSSSIELDWPESLTSASITLRDDPDFQSVRVLPDCASMASRKRSYRRRRPSAKKSRSNNAKRSLYQRRLDEGDSSDDSDHSHPWKVNQPWIIRNESPLSSPTLDIDEAKLQPPFPSTVQMNSNHGMESQSSWQFWDDQRHHQPPSPIFNKPADVMPYTEENSTFRAALMICLQEKNIQFRKELILETLQLASAHLNQQFDRLQKQYDDLLLAKIRNMSQWA